MCPLPKPNRRPVYRLAVLFPGILRATYSEAEYKQVMAAEKKLMKFIIPFCFTCLIGGLFFIALSIYILTK